MTCFITRNEENALGYTMLANSSISSGDSVQYATGYSSMLWGQDKVFVTIPDDATYLYVYMHSQSISDEVPHDYRPKKIEIGYKIKNT